MKIRKMAIVATAASAALLLSSIARPFPRALRPVDEGIRVQEAPQEGGAAKLAASLKKGWESAKRTFGLSNIPPPDSVSFLPLSGKEYERVVSEGDDEWIIYPTSKYEVAFATDQQYKTLVIFYPREKPPSEAECANIAAFAVLRMAPRVEPDAPQFFPSSSVHLLYSRLDGNPPSPEMRKCTYSEALVLFASFAANPDDPMEFYRLYSAGKISEINKRVDNLLGKGAWESIIRAELNGTDKIKEINRLASGLGPKKKAEFAAFQGKFSCSAPQLTFAGPFAP